MKGTVINIYSIKFRHNGDEAISDENVKRGSLRVPQLRCG